MSNRLLNYHSCLLTATALLSVALIAFQVSIIQLLSLVQWYHFANMVISVALLGFGAAGTLLSLKRRWLMQHSETLLPLLMILCGLTMVSAVELSRSGFAKFDSYLLFADKLQWLRLLVNYILYFIPFLLGALALGIIFIKYVAEIGRFYFANLAGSGIGALLAAILAWYFFPAALPAVTALFVIAAGLLLLQHKTSWMIIALAFPVSAFIFFSE